MVEHRPQFPHHKDADTLILKELGDFHPFHPPHFPFLMQGAGAISLGVEKQIPGMYLASFRYQVLEEVMVDARMPWEESSAS